MAKNKLFKCHGCGALTTTSDIYCTPQCRTRSQAAAEAAVSELVSAGFEQHPDAPNVFTQGGVSVTIEHVRQHGIDKVR